MARQDVRTPQLQLDEPQDDVAPKVISSGPERQRRPQQAGAGVLIRLRAPDGAIGDIGEAGQGDGRPRLLLGRFLIDGRRAIAACPLRSARITSKPLIVA